MSIFVKICGLCSPDDVQAVAELGPDAMGFVFWPGSKRHVSAASVAEWTKDLPGSILKVGVFVEGTPSEIAQAVQEAGLDVVQLHGFQSAFAAVYPPKAAPSAARAAADKSLEKEAADFPRIGKKGGGFSNVWKVVHLERSSEVPEDLGRVDACVLDSYSAESPGGTGLRLDWNKARDFVKACRKPVLLAGGLTPENVEEAIRRVRPWGVDVSSGVEKEPGRKDIARVRVFVDRCRRE